MHEDTIVAVTGQTTQAIAIIRLSGGEAKAIANRVLQKSISKQASHTIEHNFVIEGQQVIDEVMVSYFKAPQSYTGEDTVEINIHGGPYISHKVVSRLLAEGARPAQPGEFTQRAYLNGKLDLTQAEAINDLILANSEYNATKAMAALSQAISKMLEPLIAEIHDLIANIEVNIDYPEYDDVSDLSQRVILPQLRKWLELSAEIVKKSESSLLIKDGILTVIVGEPNVGKSSLLNALLQENRALVSEIAGTTRDYIEAEVLIDNLHLRLIDTAGLRTTGDTLEKLGMEKTQELLEKAQLVIVVFDATKQRSRQELELLERLKNQEYIVVYNKSDLTKEKIAGIKIAAINNDIAELVNALKDKYETTELINTTTLHSPRQVALMKQATSSLSSAVKALEENRELELVAIDLEVAYQSLCDILGKYSRIDLLESIFQNFCLGK